MIHPYIPGIKLLQKPSRHDQKTKKKNKKKKKNKDREPDETDETPMVLDDENNKNSDVDIQEKKGIFLLSLINLQKKH